MRKGISPLIAAVILLAFTIAVAGIASQFFLGFTERQKETTQRKGQQLTTCSEVQLDIILSRVVDNTPNNITLVVENDGDSVLRGLKVTTFNDTAVVNDGAIVPSSIDSASTEKLMVNRTVSGGLSKIEVSSTECPGRKTAIKKNEYGEWQAIV